MKIVYIFDDFEITGGIQKMLVEKINYLCAHTSHEVYIISYKSELNSFFSLTDKVKIICLGLALEEQDFQKRFEISVSDCLKKIKAGIVLTPVYSRAYGFLPNLKDGSKKIAEFHTCYEYAHGFTNIRSDFRKYFIERLFFFKIVRTGRKYDAFVVLSETDAQKWTKHITNTTVIPNWIDYDNDFPNNEDSKTAIAVGRLEGVKSFHSAISAWANVVKIHPSWQLKIYGRGPLHGQLASQIHSLCMQDHVFICDPVPNLKKQYKEAGIFINTSSFEGFGLVILEAMASGLPVLSMKMRGGGNDLIINGKTGISLDSRNPEIFSEEIIKIIENPAKRKAMGEAAVERSKDFRSDNIMSIWLDLFERLKNNKSA